MAACALDPLCDAGVAIAGGGAVAVAGTETVAPAVDAAAGATGVASVASAIKSCISAAFGGANTPGSDGPAPHAAEPGTAPDPYGNAAERDNLGDLVDVNVDDPAADALADKIGGRASVRFSDDPTGREFDAVSDEYVAQAKPSGMQLGSSFRDQAKATFEAAIQTGRTPYFQFAGAPTDEVLAKLGEYATRYRIKPVIDISGG